jgi:hypothetical protein
MLDGSRVGWQMVLAPSKRLHRDTDLLRWIDASKLQGGSIIMGRFIERLLRRFGYYKLSYNQLQTLLDAATNQHIEYHIDVLKQLDASLLERIEKGARYKHCPTVVPNGFEDDHQKHLELYSKMRKM